MLDYYSIGWIVIVLAMILTVYSQSKIKSTFNSYSKVYSKKGITGYQAARILLDRHNMSNIPIEMVRGQLTDHYDPKNKVLRLSESVYASSSIAAIGVAAHEVGHAIQDQKDYAPLHIRNSIFPIVSISSRAAFPLILLGLFMGYSGLFDLGILVFAVTVIFQIITLPVEFDASNRAIKELESGLLLPDEIAPVKKVLGAAALTYIAAALASLGNLIRFMGMRRD
ncbi:MAG: zinc metallopeptidase [Andreesenia angusta]|nr:zinc metallopeptidase [Andreesenia angusta]